MTDVAIKLMETRKASGMENEGKLFKMDSI